MELKNFKRFDGEDDDVRELALAEIAMSPAREVDPAGAMGESEWSARLNDDLLSGGANAFDAFRNEWDFGTSPTQRAAAVSRVSFIDSLDAAVAGLAESSVRPWGDPAEFSSMFTSARNGGV